MEAIAAQRCRQRRNIAEHNNQPLHYGNNLSNIKKDSELLCVFNNINGLPRTPDQPKEKFLWQLITHYDIDIMGWAEVNLHWNKVRHKERWEEQSVGWWENFRTGMAFNTEDEASKATQGGGCLQIVKNKAAIT